MTAATSMTRTSCDVPNAAGNSTFATRIRGTRFRAGIGNVRPVAPITSRYASRSASSCATAVWRSCSAAWQSLNSRWAARLTLTYSQVLRSHRWRQLKWRRLMVAGFACERCLSAFVGRRTRDAMKCFELHHTNYDRVGSEGIDDVRVVCAACHSIIHDKGPREVAA